MTRAEVLNVMMSPLKIRAARELGNGPRFTPREMDVLKLLATGMCVKETARALNLSAKTIAVHKVNMMRQAGVHTTIQMVIFALQSGLITIEGLQPELAMVGLA